jgi:hypothetical protein
MTTQLGLFERSAGEPVAERAPVLLRHPQANRECQLGHALVAYEFRRARRKTIGLVVNPNSAPI